MTRVRKPFARALLTTVALMWAASCSDDASPGSTTTVPATTAPAVSDDDLISRLLRPADLAGTWTQGWPAEVVPTSDITASLIAFQGLCNTDSADFDALQRLSWRVRTAFSQVDGDGNRVTIVEALVSGDPVLLAGALTTLEHTFRHCLGVEPREDGWIAEVHGQVPGFGVVGVIDNTAGEVPRWTIDSREFRLVGSTAMVVVVAEDRSATPGCRRPEPPSVGSCRFDQGEVIRIAELAAAKLA